MHRWLPILALVAALTGCGETAPPSNTAPDAGRAGKQRPALGRVAARVLERPSTDRAWIEADWSLAPGATGCEIHLSLPDRAVLVEGEAVTPLPEHDAGRMSWLVEFPTGEALDAVIRLCAETPGGHRASEAYVRLAE